MAFPAYSSDQNFTCANPFLAAQRNRVTATLTAVASTSGANPDPLAMAVQTHVIGLRSDGTLDVVILDVKQPLFTTGGIVPLDWGSGFGAVFNFNPTTATATMVGLILEGVVQFTHAGTTPGASVSGTFQGKLIKFRD